MLSGQGMEWAYSTPQTHMGVVIVAVVNIVLLQQ